jgi:PAS domain S-box-containing protein
LLKVDSMISESSEEDRAQVTLDSIGDAVMTSDADGNVTYLNGVAASMTGWAREEATGRPVTEVANRRFK